VLYLLASVIVTVPFVCENAPRRMPPPGWTG